MVDAKVTEVVPFDFGKEEESKSDDAFTDKDADAVSKTEQRIGQIQGDEKVTVDQAPIAKE